MSASMFFQTSAPMSVETSSQTPIVAHKTCSYHFDKEVLLPYIPSSCCLEDVMLIGVHRGKGVFFCPAEATGGGNLLAILGEGEDPVVSFEAQTSVNSKCGDCSECENCPQCERLQLQSITPTYVSVQLDKEGRIHLLEKNTEDFWDFDEDDRKKRFVEQTVTYTLFGPDLRIQLHLELPYPSWGLLPSHEGEVYLVDYQYPAISGLALATIGGRCWAFFPALALLEFSLPEVMEKFSLFIHPPFNSSRRALAAGNFHNFFQSVYTETIKSSFSRYDFTTKTWKLLFSWEDEEIGSSFLPLDQPGGWALLFLSGKEIVLAQKRSGDQADPLFQRVTPGADFSEVTRLVSGGDGTVWALENTSGKAYRLEVAPLSSWQRASAVVTREATHALYRPGGEGYERARKNFLDMQNFRSFR